MDSGEEDLYYDSDGDWAEEGSVDEEPGYSAASSRHKNYKILKEEDIKHLQQNDISTVSAVLSVSGDLACTLLCRNNWTLSSVYDEWFAAEDANSASSADQDSKPSRICKICFRKTKRKNLDSASCRHPFCKICWKTYIATAINDGAGCLTLRCPEPGCKAAVGFDMVGRLATADQRDKYMKYLYRSYIERNPNRKWCPAPGCDRAVELDGDGCDSYDVDCECSHRFCWSCGEERHRPVECKTVVEWLKKNSSEAENTNWILDYTKACPKCGRPIEKNKGCNHMSCGDPCRFEFCWICLKPWRKHVGASGCNKFEERVERGGEKSREMAKSFLERYTHFYERWDSNDKSRKIAMEDLRRARSKSLDHIVEAWEQIVECRRVLKWSYAYGYYLSLDKGSSGKMRLFECLQGRAEGELERLHHRLEEMKEDVCVGSEDFKVSRRNLVDLTTVTRNYFNNLVQALENNLGEVKVDEPREYHWGY